MPEWIPSAILEFWLEHIPFSFDELCRLVQYALAVLNALALLAILCQRLGLSGLFFCEVDADFGRDPHDQRG